MIVLKEVKHYPDSNSVEATWVDRIQLPDVEVPASEAVLDEEGNIITPAVEAHTVSGEIKEVTVKCHSYADVQMDMLRADLGADAAKHADLIALVESNIRPAPVPTAEQIKAVQTAEAKAKLADIDLRSIRAIREYIAAQPDAPKVLKDRDAEAAAERVKLK